MAVYYQSFTVNRLMTRTYYQLFDCKALRSTVVYHKIFCTNSPDVLTSSSKITSILISGGLNSTNSSGICENDRPVRSRSSWLTSVFSWSMCCLPAWYSSVKSLAVIGSWSTVSALALISFKLELSIKKWWQTIRQLSGSKYEVHMTMWISDSWIASYGNHLDVDANLRFM